jgi:hypothetical protein
MKSAVTASPCLDNHGSPYQTMTVTISRIAVVFELDADIETMKDQMVTLMGRVSIDDQPTGSAD